MVRFLRDALESRLLPWLRTEWLLAAFGSLAVLLAMLMRWSRNMPRPASQWPALARLADLIRSRESWQRVYAIEGLSGW